MMFNRSIDRTLCICFVVLGVASFAVRGPMRTLQHSNDFAAIYASAVAMWRGEDAYDPAVIARSWIDAGGVADRAPTQAFTPSVYSPSTFVVGGPLTMLRWPGAELAMLVLNLAGMLLLLETLRRLMGLAWSDNRTLVMVGFAVAQRSFASAVSVGQLSILVTELGAMGILLGSGGKWAFSGVAYGFAVAIKAPVAAAFLAPAMLARRWKTVGVAILMMLLLTAVGVVMMGHQSQWIAHWLENFKTAGGPGGVNDPSPANPTRIQLIYLQYPLSNFIANRIVLRVAASGIALLLAAPALMALWKKPSGVAVLLPLACICVVELLGLYHRTYDATLLVFPLAWAMLPCTEVWQRLPVLGLLAVFILPGAGLPVAGESHGWFWNNVVLPRDAWTIFLLSGWLSICQTWEMMASRREGAARECTGR